MSIDAGLVLIPLAFIGLVGLVTVAAFVVIVVLIVRAARRGGGGGGYRDAGLDAHRHAHDAATAHPAHAHAHDTAIAHHHHAVQQQIDLSTPTPPSSSTF